jgi:hypothetical protein
MKRVVTAFFRDRAAVAIAALAFAVYVAGVTWGIPYASGPDRVHAWGNDDAGPLVALAEMHDTFVKKPAFRNVAYPWFHYFLMASVMAPYIAWLYVTGSFSRPSASYPFGLEDPIAAFWNLALLARLLSVLLSVAAVLGAYYGAKFLWGRRAGILAALFTAFMFPLAYYARLTNPDAPVIGWTALGLMMAALILRHGLTALRAAWFTAFVALAAATKDQSLGSFFLLVPVLLWICLRHPQPAGSAQPRMRWGPPVAGVLTFAVVYVCASGIPVDPGRYAEHANKILFAGTTRSLYLRHPATPAGALNQVGDLFGYLLDVMSWPLFLCAVAGIIIAARRDRRSLVLLLSSLGFFLMLIPVGMSRVHYLLAVALPLNYFAAYAIDRAMELRPVRIPAAAFAAFIVGVLALQTADLTWEMLHDSRYAAGTWLDAHTRAGDRVLHFGFASKLPRLKREVESIRIIYQREALDALMQKRPEYVLVIPQDITEDRKRVEWRQGPPSVITPTTAELVEQLANGSLDYRLVARFQEPRLLPWLDRPFLSYPTVNPPVHIFARADRAAGMPVLEPWHSAPHYPRFMRVVEVTVNNPRDSEVAR